ncbi:uncharacterized protein LOC130629959 [Hydractinia symbiolongicarpus]|uniref:uncharacterized protein LOC130629959 n=1 Tax=Hydractinia symbiolongicarpus TaxID=13093 RepID=UPI00254EB3B0|nr:uncharacterized protein LOC130629959 [Hydractinia symbiolongicarpus]
MISKFIILALVGICLAKKAILPIEEGGEKFEEKIETDVEAGTEMYETPDHCGRKAVRQLIHTKSGLCADRVKGEKTCVITPSDPAVDRSVHDVENGLEKSKGKFPYHKVVEVTNKIMLVPFPNPENLPKAIRKFCKGRTIVKGVIENKEEKELEEKALEIAKAAKKNSRKRAVIREFIACTGSSTMVIMTCPGEKLEVKCKIRSSSCTYHVTCPMELQKGGFDCKGLHKFNSAICCDYKCRK